MEKVLKVKSIYIVRSEANFDRACDEARNQTSCLFDIDEDGHSSLEGWTRSSCSIELKFISYEASFSMTGASHNYIFEATAKSYDES